MAYLDYPGLQRYHGKIEDDFAKIDGAYEGMTVGNAEELVTGLEEEESVPFIFRTSGGQLEIGAREDLTVVGGSLAWNQLVKLTASSGTTSGITFTNNGDGSWTIDGTATERVTKEFTEIPTPINHIFAVFGCPAGGSSSTYYLGFGGLAVDKGNGGIWKNTTAYTALNCRLDIWSGQTFSNTKIYPQVIDLTVLFGSTIADYIYSLEQNTAGAGVAFFKKLFPKSYYPYNEGELLSVNASAFKTVGFNAYNAETHTAKVLGGIEYKIEGAYTSLSLTDIDGNISTITPSSGLFTPNANGTITVTGYGADTCIFIHWDNTRDGEYEPYVEHGYALDSDLTLRGVPKLDADNNLYYDGDTYASDGTVTRKYELYTFTGNETWVQSSDTAYYCTITNNTIKKPADDNTVVDWVLFPNLKASTRNLIAYGTATGDVFAIGATGAIWISAEVYNDRANKLTGKSIVYELATPTTETADAFQKPQIVDNWGTEEFTVIEQSGVAVPVGHNTIYPISLRDKLEAMPNLPSEDGDYILRMRSGEPAYIALANEFPAPPTTDGTYTLQATVSSGAATLTWEEVNA